tara:strand:+ start:17020 stop:18714 length:1695 start_codon:yes stop_codon:yes gene_type:complete
VIHLLISNNHLLCVQWEDQNGKPAITSLLHKPFKPKKQSTNLSDKELLTEVNSALQLLKKQLSFEGEKVFVTISDSLSYSTCAYFDEEMSDTDGWEYSKWIIDQRYSSDEKQNSEYFGRSFKDQTNSVFSLRVSTALTENIKMSVQELGADPVWMGTESSVYYGLNPSRGVTIFYSEKSGYEYYHYSKNCFMRGNAKFSKDNWKLSSTDGSLNEKEIFKGQIIIPGKLSYRRKSHFEGKRIRQVEAFKNIKKNNIKIPKNIKHNDLYVTTALINGNVYGFSLNFFEKPGLQEYEEKKALPLPPQRNSKVKKRKPKRKKRKSNFQQIFAYLFFFSALTAVIFRDQLPEIYEFIKDEFINLNQPKSSVVDPLSLPVVETESVFSDYQKKSFIKSQSLINSVDKIFNFINTTNLLNINVQGGEASLEFLDTKTTVLSVDSIGNILNYSLRQVGGDDQYKHGYLVQYAAFINSDLKLDDYISLDQLDENLLIYKDLKIKKFELFSYNALEHTPIIITATNSSSLMNVLSYIKQNGSNLVLEKFDYNYSQNENLFSSKFFITFINYNDS